jgi:hypothetical protein
MSFYSFKAELFFVSFERLDFGATDTLDQFYNADVAIVDMSVRSQQAALSYHIGVRQNMGSLETVIMLHDTDPEFTLSAKVCYFLNYPLVNITFVPGLGKLRNLRQKYHSESLLDVNVEPCN